jgi:hypothetical protein
MFFPEGAVRVHLYGRPVDLRKSYDSLYVLARHALQCDPTNGHLYVFINRVLITASFSKSPLGSSKSTGSAARYSARRARSGCSTSRN